MAKIEQVLAEKILVLDGAMGTMLQAYKFEEEDFRGERFKDHSSPLKGIMTYYRSHSQKRLKPSTVNTLKLEQT